MHPQGHWFLKEQQQSRVAGLSCWVPQVGWRWRGRKEG